MATSSLPRYEELLTKKKAQQWLHQQLEDEFTKEQKAMNNIEERIAELKSSLAKLQSKRYIRNRALSLIQGRCICVTSGIFKTKSQLQEVNGAQLEGQLLTKWNELITEHMQLEDAITEKTKAMEAIDEQIVKIEATLDELNKELPIHSLVLTLIQDRLTNVTRDVSKTECQLQVANEARKSRRKIMKLIKLIF